jgi:hypothetical protein
MSTAITLLFTLAIVAASLLMTLVVTVISLAIPGFILWKLYQQSQESAALLRTGTAATATILDVATTGTEMNHDPQVRLTLQVKPAGQPPFTAVTHRFVSIVEIPRVQPGCEVAVRFDPANPARVAIERI